MADADIKKTTLGSAKSIWLEIFIRIFFLFTHQILRRTQTFKQNIHYNDWDHHMYPYTQNEVIPSKLLFFLTIIVPFTLIIISYVVHVTNTQNGKISQPINMPLETTKWFYFADFLDAFFYFSLSIFLTCNIVNFLKTAIGRPRPDFFSRCWPILAKRTRFETLSFRQKLSMDMNGFVCDTEGKKIMKSAFKSFPSGHSAYTCVAMACMFYYLAGKLATFNKQGKSKGWKLVVLYPFIFLTLFVGVSRISDYRHFSSDVISGWLIGFVISTVVYWIYYPSIFHSTKSKYSYRQLQLLEVLHKAQNCTN